MLARKRITRFINWLRGYTIPQPEIDREAARMIDTYGIDAIHEAEQQVQRAQWSKGNSNTPERTARILRAVKRRKHRMRRS